MIMIIILDVANAAANAVIAQQAAAARLALASQAYATCREQTNPYLPGNAGLFGPSRAQMWGQDPCQEQEQELIEAQEAARALSQVAGEPQAAQTPPAPQLSQTADPQLPDPAIPESEFHVQDPTLENMWSPDTVLEVMDMIAAAMEEERPGSSESEEAIQELEQMYHRMVAFLSWNWMECQAPKKRLKFNPKNQEWIKKWLPP